MSGTTFKRRPSGSPARISLGFTLMGLPLVCCIGCGSRGTERAIVSGTVTLGGKPLAQAEIRFVPIEGTQAPISGAAIVDGRYKVRAKGGVPVGTHKVVIEAFRPLPGVRAHEADDDNPLANLGPKEQYVPARYNQQSELRLVIPPGSSLLVRDFELAP